MKRGLSGSAVNLELGKREAVPVVYGNRTTEAQSAQSTMALEGNRKKRGLSDSVNRWLYGKIKRVGELQSSTKRFEQISDAFKAQLIVALRGQWREDDSLPAGACAADRLWQGG